MYDQDVEKVIIPHQRIAARVEELAGEIMRDHAAADGSGGEVTIIPVLTGAMVFAADLIRRLRMRMKMGYVAVSSYPGRSVRSRGPVVVTSELGDVTGRPVLLVDDIIDTGATLSVVQRMIAAMKPAALRTCVLLKKNVARRAAVSVEYVGFDIPDVFVVGYGLDFGDYYRNLPDIVTLKPAAMGAAGSGADGRR